MATDTPMADNLHGHQWGSSRGKTRAWPAFGMAFLILAATSCGCAGPAKKSSVLLEKYFPQRDPESCLVGFVFALENRQWDAAYSRLSLSTREKIGRFKFKYGLPLVKDPKTGIPVLNIITDSVSDRSHLPRAPGQPADIEKVRLNYIGKDTEGRVAAYIVTVYLRDEREADSKEPLWRLDLVRTAEELSSRKG